MISVVSHETAGDVAGAKVGGSADSISASIPIKRDDGSIISYMALTWTTSAEAPTAASASMSMTTRWPRAEYHREISGVNSTPVSTVPFAVPLLQIVELVACIDLGSRRAALR